MEIRKHPATVVAGLSSVDVWASNDADEGARAAAKAFAVVPWCAWDAGRFRPPDRRTARASITAGDTRSLELLGGHHDDVVRRPHLFAAVRCGGGIIKELR